VTATIAPATIAAATVRTEAPPSTAPDLLALLEEAVSLVAVEDDPGRFSTRTPAGTALTSLAGVARHAAATLGAGVTPHLTDGPGVVVVRDLVAATRLLRRTVAVTSAGDADVQPLLTSARGVHATLQDLLTTAP
jgi:hypothetical protein